VSAAGGELTEFAKPDKSLGETDYIWPIATPDGNRIIFTIWRGSLPTATLGSVPVGGGTVTHLGLKGIRPLAVIDRTLVYVQSDGAVMGVQLNRSATGTSGDPSPVLDPVTVVPGNNGNSGIFVSRGGALVSSRGQTRTQLAWMTRDGRTTPVSPEVRGFENPRLAPDGRRIAVVEHEQDKSSLWIYDLQTGTFSRLPTADAPRSPAWSPDGQRVIYVGAGDTKERFAIWSQTADGGSPPEKLADGKGLTNGVVISPDGKSLIMTAYYNNSWDLFRVGVDSGRSVQLYLSSRSNEFDPRFSPDGHWVTIASDESGRNEVYARSFPNASARVQISSGGGADAIWSADGKTIYYSLGRALIEAKLATTPTLRVLSRDTVVAKSALIRGDIVGNQDFGRDGRVLGLTSSHDDFQLVVVPNWLAELRQRLNGGKK
jgi:Periplasmic component of the Tol biopolymer transport system